MISDHHLHIIRFHLLPKPWLHYNGRISFESMYREYIAMLFAYVLMVMG